MSNVLSNGHTDRIERRIGELEDKLKNAKERLEDLRGQYDAQSKTIADLLELIDDEREMREQWKDAFNMVLNDKDQWDWPDWVRDHDELLERYVDLRARWNRFVGEYNGVVAPRMRNFGRPIAASHSQQADVRKRRKAGQSLRDIAEETNLSLRTVRTIVDKVDGLDRATLARLERVAPDKLREASERRRKRLRDELPKRIATISRRNDELRKEAKGLMQR